MIFVLFVDNFINVVINGQICAYSDPLLLFDCVKQMLSVAKCHRILN